MNPRYIEELSWRFGEVYAACVDRILINLARHFKYVKNGQFNGSWDYQVKKLAEMGQVTRETEAIILSMLGDADGALRDTLEAAVIDGLRGCEPELRKAVEKGYLHGGIPELHPTQMNAFKAYYEQSADKLNLVNTVMLESTQWAYQSTVADIVTRMNTTQGILNIATGEVVSGVSPINKAVHDAVQKMVENGITGFIDHGGHKWSPETYVTMDVRTTMGNAAREAVFERNKDYGNDLYQVSWHDAARPLCFPWQCKVISSQDLSREVEDDDGNTVHVYAQSETTYGQPAGLFGINCGHYPIPFIPNFSRIREPRQDAEENAKAYQESQQQRYLERRLREEKRDLEVLKAQGATDEEIKLQRQKVRKASDNLDEFCDETGRARRRSREATPINATWPDTPAPTQKATVPPVNVEGNSYGYSVKGLKDPINERPKRSMFSDEEEYQKARAAYKEKSEKYKENFFDQVDKAASVKRFDTQEQVKAWADSQGITISKEALETLDLRTFNESSFALDEMFGRFPEVKSYEMELFDGEILKTSFRIDVDNTGLLSANHGLNFNPSAFKDYRHGAMLGLSQMTDGFNVVGDGTFSTFIRHEYGHNVQEYIENKMSRKYHYFVDDWRKYFSTLDEYKATQDKYRSEHKRFETELLSLAGLEGSSEYSNTNIYELFAEGFAEYASGGTTKFGKAFGEFLKRWY